MILGAAIGFMAVLVVLTLEPRSPWILYSLWPTNVLQNATVGMSEIWRLTFQVMSFFGNVFLYGLVGSLVGGLLPDMEVE